MANGLRINNGNGDRVVDDNFDGTFYIGKKTISAGGGSFSIPGYSSSIPPLMFLKLNTSGRSTITNLENATGVAPGGINTFSVDLPSSDITYRYWIPIGETVGSYGGFTSDSARCAANGGSIVGGVCVRTTDLTVRINTKINDGRHGQPVTDMISTGSGTVGTSTTISASALGAAFTIPETGEGYIGASGTGTYGGSGDRFTWTSTSNNSSQGSRTLNGVKWWDTDGSQITSGGTSHSGALIHTQSRTYQTGTATLSFDSSGHVTGMTANVALSGYNDSAAFNAPNSISGSNVFYAGDDYFTMYSASAQLSGTNFEYPDGSDSNFFPYNTTANRFARTSELPSGLVSSLSQGWVCNVDTSDSVTVYAFGIGGDTISTDNMGLEVIGDDGRISFSTRRPPANIVGYETVQMNGVSYTGSGTGSVSGLYPVTTTAVSFTPPLSSSVVSTVFKIVAHAGGGLFAGTHHPVTNSSGLRYNTSGGNVSALVLGIGTPTVQSSVFSVSLPITNASVWTVQPPAWKGVESGGGAIQDVYRPPFHGSTNVGGEYIGQTISQAWDLEGDVVFLDTTVYDRSEFDNFDFT